MGSLSHRQSVEVPRKYLTWNWKRREVSREGFWVEMIGNDSRRVSPMKKNPELSKKWKQHEAKPGRGTSMGGQGGGGLGTRSPIWPKYNTEFNLSENHGGWFSLSYPVVRTVSWICCLVLVSSLGGVFKLWLPIHRLIPLACPRAPQGPGLCPFILEIPGVVVS